MSNTYEQDKTEKALKNFLLDIDCLNKVSPWINKFNVFDVLKLENFEIRHSNMLAWLLDPNENHGLGDKVLLGLIKFITTKPDSLSAYELCQLINNSYSFSVLREYNNIDILLVSHENKIVICIENKIYSGEHDNQLERYKEIVETRFRGYKQFYLYLTLSGNKSSNPDVWFSISYTDMKTIIETACKHIELTAEVKLFINNYIEVIKRKIMMNETEIKKVCNEIYMKHKKALDLIYTHKSSELELIYLNLKDWLAKYNTGIDKDSLWFQADKIGMFIRFKSFNLSKLFPNVDQSESGWKRDSFYYYELYRMRDSYQFYLAFSYNWCSDENKKKIDEFLEKMGKKDDCKPSQWGYIVYYLEQKEYDIDTFMKGDFESLIKNIRAEEEKIKEQY